MDFLKPYSIPKNGLLSYKRGDFLYDIVCVDMPRTLDARPEPPINTNYFSHYTDKDMRDWYDLIFSPYADIIGINGMRITLDDDIWCGYCREIMEEDGDYCYHCHRYVCRACSENPDARLQECRTHNAIQPRKYLYFRGHLNFPDSSDRKSIPYFQGEFGSLLDWVPLFTDTLNYDEFAIFMNLNPDSLRYRRIAVRTFDSHGRIGFFVLYGETLESLVHKMTELEKAHNESANDSQETDSYELEHWTPLRQIVKDMDLDYD